LANIKSQIKRNRQNEKRRVRNRTYRGAARTAVNQARTAAADNAPGTKETVMQAISTLDKAAAMGVIHANNAARRKSRLMKLLASFGVQPAAKKIEEPKPAPAKAAEPVVEPVEEPKKKAPAKKAAATKKTAAPRKTTAAKKPAAKKRATKKK
jgi:small subunit ribosomal protein S20